MLVTYDGNWLFESAVDKIKDMGQLVLDIEAERDDHFFRRPDGVCFWVNRESRYGYAAIPPTVMAAIHFGVITDRVVITKPETMAARKILFDLIEKR